MNYKYKIENLLFPELRDRAVVPKFQRKLVWSKKEKENFITTLSNGHPFGSILIYKYEDEDKYSIVDGLQRFTTIEDYIHNPEKYIEFDEFTERIINVYIPINSISPSALENSKKIIDVCIQTFVRSEQTGTLKLYQLLQDTMPEYFGSDDLKKYTELEQITSNLLKSVKTHLNVDSLPIPTIVFTGAVEELATVFENLNKGGKKLSKYQVFAAQWSKHELKLSNDLINNNILDLTIQRYEDLIESRNVEINNFSKEDLLEDRTINVAEFCYALGKLILEEMPVFWNKDNEDTANQIGYSTLSMVFGIKNKDMTKLVNYFDKLDNSQFIENFTKEILTIYRDMNNIFADKLKTPGLSSNNYYGGQTASDFQLMSIFGSLWSTKFESLQSGKLVIRPKYKINYDIIEKNLLRYFIFDIVTGRWSGSGDSKLDAIVIDKENYYLQELDKQKFETALLNWHDDILNKSSINFDQTSRMLYTVLISYYKDLTNEKKYDSEHIIARKSISDIRKQSNRNIPGGSLGNLMYLDSLNNRSKQEFSLYDAQKPGYNLDRSMLDYQAYPSNKVFKDIKFEIERKNGDYDTLIETISKRGKKLINDLVFKVYNAK